jgi:hypothetical protein
MNKKCVCCEERKPKDEMRVVTVGEDKGKPICETCYDEDEPQATVFYNGDKEEPKFIGNYTNDTEGDFTLKWVSTDGWRGYYDVTPNEKWVRIVDDCILSYSEDAEQLHEMQEKLEEFLKSRDIEFAKVFARTSNCFSTGYDFFVEKGEEDEAKCIVAILKLKYRDPDRFNMTALTGKESSKEFDQKDKLLLEAFRRIEKGESFDDIKDDILKRVEKVV